MSAVETLVCPLCRGSVSPSSAGCSACHLTVRDILRHGPVRPAPSRAGAALRALVVRISGLLLYAAAVAWCYLELPGALPFVVPGAVLGGGLHVMRGRPWWGLLVFTLVVAALPFVLAPALGVGTFSDWTDGR